MKQLLIIKLVVWLGWLSCIALAQLELGDALTGSVSFPSVGVTCIGNLAAFFSSFLRRRLDLEMGARDFMATTTGPEMGEKIPSEEGKGLTTITNWKYASVVMLSTDTSHSSIHQFRKYMQNAHNVHSILLPCKRFDAESNKCRCIEITIQEKLDPKGKPSIDPKGQEKLIDRPESVPSASETPSINAERHDDIESSNVQTFKEKLDWNTHGIIDVTKSRWLLPCSDCLKYGCHGGPPKNDFPAVCNVLESVHTKLIQKKPICICIPLNSASEDDWTRALIRSFKSKDQEDRGATVKASDALQSYLDGSGLYTKEDVSYRTALIIVPRLAEILINLLLTVWFKIDGFSSSLVARRAIRNHVVDSKGIGLPASAFLTHAQVNVKSSADKSSADKSNDHKDCPYKSPADKSSADESSADKSPADKSSAGESSAHKSSVCQVLTFRGTGSSIRILSSIVGGFNLICSVYWAVFIAFDGGARKWYEIHSILPSKPMVAVVIAAICFGLVMDTLDFWKLIKSNTCDFCKLLKSTNARMLFAMIVIEIVFAAVAGGLGLNKGIGRWVYSALQVLVWVKWGIGSYLLGVYSPDYDPTASRDDDKRDDDKWDDDGTLVYSSAFLLSAALAFVRVNWAEVRPNN